MQAQHEVWSRVGDFRFFPFKITFLHHENAHSCTFHFYNFLKCFKETQLTP